VRDDSRFGTLPRFSRDVSVLSGRTRSREDADGHASRGVLTPFTGTLDVRVQRGRVPLLDLSYLSLESVIAPRLARAAGDPDASVPSDAPSVEDRSDRPVDAAGTGREDDGPEPTVREVIFGDRTGADRGGGDRSDASEDRRPGSGLDLDAGRAGDRGDAERAEPSPGAPPRTTLDRSGASGRPASTGSGGATERRGSEGASSPGAGGADRTARGRPGAAGRTTDRPGDERSEPSFDADDRTATASSASPPRSDAPATGTGDRAAPRMVLERAPGESATRRSGRAGRLASERVGEGAPARPESAGDRPRMVVDRGEGGDERSAAAERETSGAGRADGPGRRDAGDPAVGDDDRLAAVVDASADPESRLVDRLYRTLRERHDIEQRRRGSR